MDHYFKEKNTKIQSKVHLDMFVTDLFTIQWNEDILYKFLSPQNEYFSLFLGHSQL